MAESAGWNVEQAGQRRRRHRPLLGRRDPRPRRSGRPRRSPRCDRRWHPSDRHGGRGRGPARPADGGDALSWRASDGTLCRPSPGRRGAPRAARARSAVRGHGPPGPARRRGPSPGGLHRPRRRRRARRLAPIRHRRGVRPLADRYAGTRGGRRQRRVQAVRAGHATGHHERRGVRPVDREHHRDLRRRPLHVRQQLPRRRHARHARRALVHLLGASPPGWTPPPATSCSPRTPSGCTAAEVGPARAAVGQDGVDSRRSAILARCQLAEPPSTSFCLARL